MNKIAGIVLVLGGLMAPQPDPICFEDMACWDCSAMGNGICGEDAQ